MTVTTFEAAKALGKYSGWSISNLKMQKILYMAHMFYMGRNDGKPLIEDKFEAWDYGPVVPSLYHKVKFFGSDPVLDIFFRTPLLNDETREAQILKEAFEHLGHKKPGQLVAMTHKEGGAWAEHYVPKSRGIVIPNEDIRAEYDAL